MRNSKNVDLGVLLKYAHLHFVASKIGKKYLIITTYYAHNRKWVVKLVKYKALIITTLILLIIPYNVYSTDKKTWIIEVNRNPHEVKYYIERYHPLLEVEFVYDTILQGLAVTGDERHIEKLYDEQFIQKANEAIEYAVPNELPTQRFETTEDLTNSDPTSNEKTDPENRIATNEISKQEKST